MFAGAAREAVFSRPEVIRHVKAHFIPVALKAALVNRPPGDDEGLLYREIARSRPAPQGICVVNSAGKVLNWALMFDDDKSVIAFLDHARGRFTKHPDAKRPPDAAERHARFPSRPLKDVKDSGKALPALDGHPEGKHCPAAPPPPRGTVVARLIGRALDKDGKPLADTVRQENYVEDRFTISVEMQGRLAKALAGAEKGRAPVPNEVARQWVKHAHLGVLDVQPLDNPAGHKGELKKCELRAEKVEKAGALWRITGETHVRIEKMANAGPGDLHEVKLTWAGYVEMKDDRITRLLLSAVGTEKLKFGTARGKADNEVSSLPAGRKIDMAGGVRYGIIGEPAAVTVAAGAGDLDEVPEAARRQLQEALGSPFVIFREKVQEELKLSGEQKKELAAELRDQVRSAQELFEKIDELKREEREKKLGAYRPKAQKRLAAFLQKNLKKGQLERFGQIALQQEGAFALGRPDVRKTLKITDKQAKQFSSVVEALQRKVRPLIQEAESGGNPEEIRPRVLKARKEHEGKIEALLTADQKKRWKEMLGKPFSLDD